MKKYLKVILMVATLITIHRIALVAMQELEIGEENQIPQKISSITLKEQLTIQTQDLTEHPINIYDTAVTQLKDGSYMFGRDTFTSFHNRDGKETERIVSRESELMFFKKHGKFSRFKMVPTGTQGSVQIYDHTTQKSSMLQNSQAIIIRIMNDMIICIQQGLINALDLEGNILKQFNRTDDKHPSNITSVVVNNLNHLYVDDPNKNIIQVFDMNRPQTEALFSFSTDEGPTRSISRQLIIRDNDEIIQINKDNTITIYDADGRPRSTPIEPNGARVKWLRIIDHNNLLVCYANQARIDIIDLTDSKNPIVCASLTPELDGAEIFQVHGTTDKVWYAQNNVIHICQLEFHAN